MTLYYIKLFEAWYDNYPGRGVDIVIIRSIIRGLLGKPSGSQALGYGYTCTVVLLPDGSLEGLDTLRISEKKCDGVGT